MERGERKPDTEMYPQDILRKQCRRIMGGCDQKMGAALVEKLSYRFSFFNDDSYARTCRESIEALPDTDVETFLNKAVPILQKYILDRWKTPSAFETWTRETVQRERPEAVHINDLLYYDTYEDRLYLHVYPNAATNILRLLPLLRNGFQSIAQHLQSNSALQGIKSIEGVSPLVEESADLLKKMGFSVKENEDGTTWSSESGAGVCKITKEEFLKRFL